VNFTVVSNIREDVRTIPLFHYTSHIMEPAPMFENFRENSLKVHKIEKFFGSHFEFCVISLLVMLKY
jgi:hypothetical protein